MPNSKPRGVASRPRQTVEGAAAVDRPKGPWCPRCRSADYLVFDAVRVRLDAAGRRRATWDLDYWCTECDRYFGHECNEPPPPAANLAAEVLYVHCGQPMSPAAVEPRAIGTAETGPPLHEVVLCAQVWRCGCGFELAAPELDA